MFTAVFGLIGARIVRLPRTPSNTPRAADDGDPVAAVADRREGSLGADRAARQPGVGLEERDHLLRQP